MLDRDLIFLNDCSNEQLKTLVDILVYDKDGDKRLTENISSTREFQTCYPNFLKGVIPLIVNEIQRFGGNTIMNLLRGGKGVPYREILEDVCNKMKVNYNKKLPTDLLENELLRIVAVTVIDKMTEEDIKKFDENLDKTRFMRAIMDNNGLALMSIISIVVAQITKKAALEGGMVLFGRLLAPRLIALAVPVLNALAAIWTIVDIAGPASRVTIPFVITTSFIRRQLTSSSDDLKDIFE